MRIGDLAKDLSQLGVNEEVFMREVNALAKSYCITSEDFRTSGLIASDLIALAPAGRVHLQISNDIYYLAAVSEDMLYQDEALANAVAQRIREPEQHLSTRTTFLNATALISELTAWHKEYLSRYHAHFSDTKLADFIGLSEKSGAVSRFEKSVVDGGWLEARKTLVDGTVAKGIVRNVKAYGLFVELQPNIAGLLHPSKCKDWQSLKQSVRKGDTIDVVILGMDVFGKKLELGES